APAYGFVPKQALAQYAATGCLSRTYYADGQHQLEQVLSLCGELDAEFIGKAAIFCRNRGYMKDMPALLCAVLSIKDREVFRAAFHRVIDNARMLRTFVQIMRSGAVGRKSLGTLPKRMIQDWLDRRSDEEIFKATVGNAPSLADIIKMVHPKPADQKREALYAYMIGRSANSELLPELTKAYERFIKEETTEVPQVPFQMLTAMQLSRNDWREIARKAPWQMTRMNLNTFARHGVFEDLETTDRIAARLKDPVQIARARVFPYQLMAAYQRVDQRVPVVVKEALQDALEIAINNVPSINAELYVCPDVSGSMSPAVSGHRKGATSLIRCIDVAALITAALLRKNPKARVLPFENEVVKIDINPRDSVMTNAAKLAGIGGGGTNCSAPLARLNKQKAKGDLVVFVSDNESWVDAGVGRGTAMLREWNTFKKRNPLARLVCIDIQPNRTTQAAEREDILNIGGFSDQVFEVMTTFAAGELSPEHWVALIDQVDLY
ncbi:MAG: TROVE domain-containing protein, partial [Desulfobacteraceae bacterium]